MTRHPGARRGARRLSPRLEPLEGRRLLQGGPSIAWLGQDGHDLAGCPTPNAGNGVQDIHLLVTNLPTAKAIATVDVRPAGGGEWSYNIGPYSPYNAAVVYTPNAPTADLYLDPYQQETGRFFGVVISYADGSSDTDYFQGGTADPNLWMPAYDVTAGWLGQDGKDLTGVGAGVGPDGLIDAHLSLAHLYPGSAVTAVTVTRPVGTGWASGTNP